MKRLKLMLLAIFVVSSFPGFTGKAQKEKQNIISPKAERVIFNPTSKKLKHCHVCNEKLFRRAMYRYPRTRAVLEHYVNVHGATFNRITIGNRAYSLWEISLPYEVPCEDVSCSSLEEGSDLSTSSESF